MKNTMMKILGVVLTLAILSGLLLVAMPTPVAAGDVSWTAATTPWVVQGDNINFGFGGGALWIVTRAKAPSISGTGVIFKSTDDGKTWSRTNLDTDNTFALSGATSVSMASDNTSMLAYTSYGIWRSVNAGQNWYQVTGIPVGTGNSLGGTGATGTAVIDTVTTSPTYGQVTGITLGAGGSSYLAAPTVVIFGGGGYGATATAVLSGSSVGSYTITNGGSGYTSAPTVAVWGGGNVKLTPAVQTIDSNGGIQILVGVASTTSGGFTGGVDLYVNNSGSWKNTFDGTLGSWGTADAYSVGFSPSYTTENTILAVSGNASGFYARELVTPTNTGAAWDNFVAPVKIGAGAAATATVNNKLIVGPIMAPSDWDWASSTSNRLFIGMTNYSDGTNAISDVYRVNSNQKTVNALGTGVNPYGYGYLGNSSAGTLVVGDNDSNAVVSCTSGAVNSTNLTFNSAATPPAYSGNAGLGVVGTQVKFKPGSTASAYTLFSSVKNNPSTGYGAGLYVSTDLNSFAGISFLHVSDLSKVSISNYSSSFLGLNDNYNPGAGTVNQVIIYASTDNGATWKAIVNLGNTPLQNINTTMSYATDKTIYIAQGNGNNSSSTNVYGNRILKSVDGGATWSPQGTPGGYYTTAFALRDANTYWLGSSNGIQLSTTNTATALANGQTPKFMVPLPGMFFVACSDGSVYVSTDNGVTFTQLGPNGQFKGFPGMNQTFDLPKKTIYCQDGSTGDVLKWVVGTDTSWSTAMSYAQFPAGFRDDPGTSPANTSFPIGGMQLAMNGVWYFTVGNLGTPPSPIRPASGHPLVWRSVDAITNTSATNYDLEAVPNSTPGNIGNFNPPFTPPGADAKGNNIIIVNTGLNNASTLGESSASIEVFTDSLLTPPTTSTPKDGSTLASPVNFSWGAINYNGVRYELQIAFDKDFTNLATSTTFGTSGSAGTADVVTTATVYNNVTLDPATNYYWRVRVAMGYPLAGLWSKGVAFSTKVTSLGSANTPGIDTAGRIFPANGATAVAPNSPITWGAVSNATSYDFQISTDPTFATTVDSKTGLTTTAYTPSGLKAGVTYFWQVRAVNGTTPGDWVVSAFTTGSAPVASVGPTGAAAPAAPATIIVTVPPQSAPNVVVTVAPGGAAPSTPSTPAYIWVIIAIGAVLVIAVIVLIARTRRV